MADANYYYAQMHEQYLISSGQYEDEEGEEVCGSCEHLDELCPCGCGHGICNYYGRWVAEEDTCAGHFERHGKCPGCGATTYPGDGWNYCPKCGHELEGDE